MPDLILDPFVVFSDQGQQTPATIGLGRGEWRCLVTERGGGNPLGEIGWTDISGSLLALSDMAGLTLTVPVPASDSRQARVTCDILNAISPWQHEIHLYRNGTRVFQGPITGDPLEYGDSAALIGCKDLFAWLEKRWLTGNTVAVITGKDLARIIEMYVVDALRDDDSMNMALAIHEFASLGDRTLDLNKNPRAADEIRSISKMGADFTMAGRTLVVGQADNLPVPSLGILTRDAFDDPRLTAHGASFATQVAVLGNEDPDYNQAAYGLAGGVSPKYGLVQQSFSDLDITTNFDAQTSAQARLDFVRRQPLYPSGAFSSRAPIDLATTFAGAAVDLRLQVGCRTLIGDFRLAKLSVNVSVSDSGVSETLAPLLIPVSQRIDGDG